MSLLRRFNTAINTDRRFAAWFYGALTVLWALLGIGETGTFSLVLRAIVVGCFAFVTANALIQWRRNGRWVAPRKEVGPLPPALREELQRLVDEGEPIEAIRLLRGRTGADLLTAKKTIDALERPAGRRG